MFRNMVTSLFKYERIQTTGAKAKEVSRWADHLITLAKRGDLHARRQALAIVREKNVVHKLFEHAAERYGSVSGGYTRVVKLGRRPGDAAPISLVELVYSQETKKKKTKKKKPKADAAPRKAAADSKPAVDEDKAKPAKSKPAAKATSKKKSAADEKVEKAEAKAPAKKRSTSKKEAAEAVKEEPKKKAKAAAKKDDGDTKKKKAPAKKTKKDEK
jgi:large subunit ribosomal protein L17